MERFVLQGRMKRKIPRDRFPTRWLDLIKNITLAECTRGAKYSKEWRHIARAPDSKIETWNDRDHSAKIERQFFFSLDE